MLLIIFTPRYTLIIKSLQDEFCWHLYLNKIVNKYTRGVVMKLSENGKVIIYIYSLLLDNICIITIKKWEQLR